MRKRLLALAATVALTTVAAAGAPARGAIVELRVDSSTGPSPLFEGSVVTEPHPVDGGDGSGPHTCAGPAGGPAAPTATGALDDAMRGAGISWRGNWNPDFHDFFVDRIGPFASAAPDRYWSLTVNGRFAGGGCLTTVADGDSIRFSYGLIFGEAPAVGTGEPGPGAGTTGPGAEKGVRDPGAGPSQGRLRAIVTGAARYLRRARGGVGVAWARLALALRGGRDPSQAAAALLGDRLDRRLADGSVGEDVNATALATLALLARQPGAARRAGRWLASVQGATGGFGFRPGVGADVDSTGLATWALARVGRYEAARRGASFIAAAHCEDGGFPALPAGASNSQSTGLALLALRVAGLGPRLSANGEGRDPLSYLASLSRGDGSIAYTASSSPTPVWTTAQALLGLTGRAKLLGQS